MAIFRNLSVRAKITSTYFLTIVLLILVSVVSFTRIYQINQIVSNLAVNLAKEQKFADSIVSQMWETHFYANDFIKSGSNASLGKYTRSLNILKDHMKEAEQAILDSKRQEILNEISKKQEEYVSNFVHINKLLSEKEKLSNSILNVQLTLVSGRLEKLHVIAADKRDIGLAIQVNEIQRYLSALQTFVMKFIEGGDEKWSFSFFNDYNSLYLIITEISETNKNAEAVELALDIRNSLESYSKGYLLLYNNSRELKNIIDNKLIILGQEMRGLANDISTGASNDFQNAKLQTQSVVSQTVVVLLFTFLLALTSYMYITMKLSASITKPLMELTHIAKHINTGNLDFTLHVDSKDELGILSESFNLMASNLKRSFTDLEKSQNELENRVTIRTKELSVANESLLMQMSERMKAEDEVRQLQEYLTNIIDSMPSILIGVDSELNVTLWNSKATESTGLNNNKSIGRALQDVYELDNQKLELVRKSMKSGQIVTASREETYSGNERLFQDIVIYPLTLDEMQGAVLRIDDITEKVNLEEMIIQSEKMMSIGGLAAGMAHEINNPLAGIIQSAQVMFNRLTRKTPVNNQAAEAIGLDLNILTKYLDDRNIIKMLEGIMDSGKRASTIVTNMLSFSRKNLHTEMKPNNIVEIMEKAIELASTDYNTKKKFDFKQFGISREYGDALKPVLCEQGDIQQVFLNILLNGAQAMNEEKKETKKHQFAIKIYDDENLIKIEINDNGPGMDVKTVKRIFEPFFTTKPTGKGTGLGLYVSYSIIRTTYGGDIRVDSIIDEGTTFTITLPAMI